MNEINKENISNFLAVFIEENNLEVRDVAKGINCSIATLQRIIAKKTLPTTNMIKQVGIMFTIGIEAYQKLSQSEKEKITESIGVVGGGVLGFGTITSAVGAAGSVAGLSAAGITSGLAGIGATVGGGMAVGIAAVAIIPIAGLGVGYGIVKGVKSLISNNKLNKEDIEPHWEYLKN